MSNSISLSISPGRMEGRAGTVATASLTLANQSTLVLQCRLSVEGIDPAWAQFEPEQLGLFPGDRGKSTLRIDPAPDAIPATYRAVIVATTLVGDETRAESVVEYVLLSSETQTPAAAGVLRTYLARGPGGGSPQADKTSPVETSSSVSSAPGIPLRATSPGTGQLALEVDRDSLSLPPGTRSEFRLQVRNTSGMPLTVNLSALGLPSSWLVLNPSAIALEPSQTVRGALTIVLPSDAPPGDYPLSLEVISRDNPATRVQADLSVEITEAVVRPAPAPAIVAPAQVSVPARSAVPAKPVPVAAPTASTVQMPPAAPAEQAPPAAPAAPKQQAGFLQWILPGLLVLVGLLIVGYIVMALLVPSEPPEEPGVGEPPQGEIDIRFWSDRPGIARGECTLLRWEAPGGNGVQVDGKNVPPSGDMEVCPPQTKVYPLAAHFGDRFEHRELVIEVVEGPPPPPPR